MDSEERGLMVGFAYCPGCNAAYPPESGHTLRMEPHRRTDPMEREEEQMVRENTPKPSGVPVTNRATRRACDHGQSKGGWCYLCGAQISDIVSEED